MTPTTMRETLKRQLDTWPDELVKYIFDFAQFMAQDQPSEEAFLWQKVEESRAYDQQHPEEIKTVTVEDWDSMFRRETDSSLCYQGKPYESLYLSRPCRDNAGG